MHVFVGEGQVIGEFLEGALARQCPVSLMPRVVVVVGSAVCCLFLAFQSI